MKQSAFIILSFYLTHCTYAQSDQVENKPYEFSVLVGAARAKFDIKGTNTEDYPALEVRVGGGIARNLGHSFQIKSGLNVCFRAKSESYLKDDIYYYGKGTLLPRLDETASERNHITFEIPLSGKYLIHKTNSSISAGMMGRFWQPIDRAGDLLGSQKEIGYIVGLNQGITSNLTVGLDFYWGLTAIYTGKMIGAPDITIKNRSVQIALANTFKKKNKAFNEADF